MRFLPHARQYPSKKTRLALFACATARSRLLEQIPKRGRYAPAHLRMVLMLRYRTSFPLLCCSTNNVFGKRKSARHMQSAPRRGLRRLVVCGSREIARFAAPRYHFRSSDFGPEVLEVFRSSPRAGEAAPVCPSSPSEQDVCGAAPPGLLRFLIGKSSAGWWRQKKPPSLVCY